jgi:hypothetical protein
MSPILQSLANGSARGYGAFGGAAAAAPAFESIASATGTGSSGTITFSSIPGTYQSLQLRVNMIGTVASNVILVRFNGDTGSNYARHYLAGNGSSVTAGGQVSQTSISAGPDNGFDTTYPATYLIDIHNYSNSSQNKTARIFAGMDKNAVGGSVSLHSGLWLNTNAITSISLICSSGNFTTTSTASLYGIKGA